MHALTLSSPVTKPAPTARRAARFAPVWPRLPRVAVGIAELGFVVVALTVWWSLPHTPHQFAPVMPLGLPDLPASFDAIMFAAQVLADAPQPAPLPGLHNVPALPAAPSMETVLVNLGGWAAILWGLANKIINRLDDRIIKIEQKLEQLLTVPSRLHERISQIEGKLQHLESMSRLLRKIRTELSRRGIVPNSHPLPDKKEPEQAP